jgi:folate-binding protein YgfZ
VPLTHWGLIRARGADAAAFLHGQLTNEVLGLDPGGVRLAGFCSAKGRLQASFVVWRPAPDEFLLACHASVLAATLKRLSMFVLRSQCKLTDAGLVAPAAAATAAMAEAGSAPGSPGLRCTGLVGVAAERVLAAAGLPVATGGPAGLAMQRRGVDGGTVLALPAVGGVARAVWVAPEGVAAPGAAGATTVAAEPTLSLDEWRWLEVLSGVPVIEAPTAEQFVPQMLNYELIGGVDFQKGCYPGQEVVARSQYRGTVKRRMFLFDLGPEPGHGVGDSGAAVAAPGAEVFHSGDPGQPAGMVVNAAPWPGGAGTSALVEVKLAALGGGSLHLGSADGPVLRRAALPYAVPTEGEVAA